MTFEIAERGAEAIIDLTARMGTSAAAQTTSAGEEEPPAPLPYRQAVGQRQ